MLYGIASALGFGIADTSAAFSTRRIGVLATMVLIQVVDAVALALLLLTPLPGRIHTSAGSTVAILCAGALGSMSFFLFYRALQLGPVSIVSPVFASSAAIPVILSVVLIGERLSAPAATGAVLTLAGVVLASSAAAEPNGEAGRRTAGRSRGGVPYALGACAAWGVASFLIGRTSKHVGWFLPVLGTRVVQLVVSAAVVGGLAVAGRRLRPPRPADCGPATVAALADAAGVAFLARGSQVGLLSIVSAVSSTFPLVVIAAGVALLHERPTRAQWAGITTTVVGLVVLGLGR